MTVPREHKTHRKGIVRAILAGGIVLGVGAAVTLATWNDSEYAKGTFTAGQFNMQGAADPGDSSPTWADHDSVGGAASLGFSVDASALAPGDTVYAPFAVRLAAGTTNDADVSVVADSTTARSPTSPTRSSSPRRPRATRMRWRARRRRSSRRTPTSATRLRLRRPRSS